VSTLLNGSDSSELRTRRILDGLASLVPVEVPLEKLIAGLVQLSTLLSSRDLLAVITASDLDVESLRPELALANIAVVVDRHNLRPEDVVSAGDLRRDGNLLGVSVVVEDGVGAPVAGLALGLAGGVAALAVVEEGALVDLEELELRLVDVLAVAVAGCHVGGCPAVVRAVPALLSGAAAALVVPVEGYVLAGGGFNGVWGGGGILVGNDVGAGVWSVRVRKSRARVGINVLAQLVAVDGLVSPALVGPPSRRLVTRILLGSLTETGVGLASSLELLDRGVAGHGSDEGSYKSASLEDLGHRHG